MASGILPACARLAHFLLVGIVVCILCADAQGARSSRVSNVSIWVTNAGEPQKTFYKEVVTALKESLRKEGIQASESIIREGDIPATDDKELVIAIGAGALQLAKGKVAASNLIAAATRLDGTVSQIAGGVSLESSPAKAFDTLLQLSPGIKRVLVVFPPRLQWYLKIANQAAKSRGLEVVPYLAKDLSAASTHYTNLLSYANPTTDAIWLLQGEDLINVDATLPVIVEEGWVRNFVIFSDVFDYANRGALFATYPSAPQLGADISDLVTRKLKGQSIEVVPQTPNRAINVRTATHLGVSPERIMRAKIEMRVGEG